MDAHQAARELALRRWGTREVRELDRAIDVLARQPDALNEAQRAQLRALADPEDMTDD